MSMNFIILLRRGGTGFVNDSKLNWHNIFVCFYKITVKIIFTRILMFIRIMIIFYASIIFEHFRRHRIRFSNMYFINNGSLNCYLNSVRLISYSLNDTV